MLVLGTLPGEELLRRVEYYAHPRNLFWPIVFALFGETPAAEYRRAPRLLSRRGGIALWDVCAMAERRASLDSEIKREVPNPIHDLLDAHPGIPRSRSTAAARGVSTTAISSAAPASLIWLCPRPALPMPA